MPWGWECRAKLIKQVPAKPTERKGPIGQDVPTPGPQHYEQPQIFCGKGFSKIKRSPAYTFGNRTPITFAKPATTSNAKMFNTQGMSRKGRYIIKYGVVSPRYDTPGNKTQTPGPAVYAPPLPPRFKRLPAYSMRPAARPPYQPWDMWTPPANMYHPPLFDKKAPAYTLGCAERSPSKPYMPGPGEYEPNFNYIKKKKPAFSFGAPYKPIKPALVPPPNIYCVKKLMVSKRTIPAPSFGIRHSKYIGEHEAHLKSSKLDLVATG